MRRTVCVPALLALAIATAPLALLAQQQAGIPASGRVELTTSSDVAKNEFRQLLFESTNLRGPAAREHALKALQADPSFGLVRVFLATAQLSPQLTTDERVAEINRAIASMSGASAAELLWAVAVRENVAGRTASSTAIIKTAAQLAPNEPVLAFTVFQNERAGKTPEQLLAESRPLIQKFPDYAVGYNQYAYDHHSAGDHEGEITALRNYVRLAPTQPNAHDTWADITIQHGRLEEAIGHANASIRLDSTWAQGYAKIGAVRLQQGNANEARAQFAKSAEVAPTTAAKLDARNWVAVSYVYNHDGKSAARELGSIIGEAASLNGTGAQKALPHQRLAFVEAMFGDKKNIAPHLGHAAAITGVNPATQAYYSAIAHGTAGDAAATQTAVDAFVTAPAVTPAQIRTMKAWAAVIAKNWAAAETELAQVGPNDYILKALKAEVLKQQGKTAEAKAIKDELLGMNVKLNANPGVDFNKLVARLRAERI